MKASFFRSFGSRLLCRGISPSRRRGNGNDRKTEGRSDKGFTLIELMVVISIIAVMIGILFPVLGSARRAAIKTTCKSNLRQLGIIFQIYADDFEGILPDARSIPAPFLPTSTSPSIKEVFSHYIDSGDGPEGKIYKGPGDNVVFPLAGMSYDYHVALGGDKIENFFPVAVFGAPIEDIWVMRDFDAIFPAMLDDGSTVDVPKFHDLRNLLFADGRAGNFE